MSFWQSITGMLTVDLTSADIKGMLMAMQDMNMDIRNIEMMDPLCVRFQILRTDMKRLAALVEKQGAAFTVIGCEGIFWQIQSLRKRPVLAIGILLLLAFTLWVPGRIFFVEVQGNTTISSRQIVQVAAQCGISFGSSRRDIRSEKMKNALLEALPGLSWAGINTHGCTAVITVREREPEQIRESHSVSSIVASRDGIIRGIIVMRGNGLCTVGQAVKAGQVLISGYTDCGLSIQATCAEGEVYATTMRQLTAFAPCEYNLRLTQTVKKRKYSLLIGKKRINFTNSSGISGRTCAKIYTEKYITLSGGFVLPFGFAVETWIEYETDLQIVPDGDRDLRDFARNYLNRQMHCGTIELSREDIQEENGLYCLRGIYSCCEMIGIHRVEERLTDYVKNN